MSKVFVYGSLKRGEYNHSRFDFDRQTTYVGGGVADGVAILQAKGYPYPHAIVREGASCAGQVFEWKEHSDYTQQAIARMEDGAGYVSHDVLVTYNGISEVMPVWVANEAQTKRLLMQPHEIVDVWTGRDAAAA